MAHRAPNCHGDAVEQSEAVAEIAQRFFDFPAADHGWNLHIAEARDFITHSRQDYDLIVVDIAEGPRTPAWLTETDFLETCRERLSHEGVLVINLLPLDAADFARSLAPIRDCFPCCTACLSVPEQRSILVFAFREPVISSDAKARIPALATQYGLPFAEFFQRMQTENPQGSGVF